MHWLLTLVVFFGGPNGVAVTSVPFQDQAACQSAADELQDGLNKTEPFLGRSSVWECAPQQIVGVQEGGVIK